MTDTISVGDGSLAISTQGSGEPVLLVHGALVADSYGPMLDAGELASGYQVMTYHRRGFGGSSGVLDGHTIADEASDALAVLDHFGFDRAHVVGHSYGGAVVLQLALDAPERVHSLGLFEPALLTVPAAEAFAAGVGPVAESFEAGDFESTLLGFLTLVGGENPLARLPNLPAQATEQALADIATLFAGDLPALSQWVLSDDDARSIEQPALTVLGTESETVFKEAIEMLERNLPNAESCSLVGAVHFLQMEQPTESSSALELFLGRHPVGA